MIGGWEENAIDQLEITFPAIIKELESKMLTGELDARCQQRITVHHRGFTCDADPLGSHGYVYIAVYAASVIEVTRIAKP
ncbi:type IV toxin-antitoxin system YeeU family antitoxin [Aeromonas sp. MdU4]|uniref:type IV toxin-antitoxin system YeeU family antitoxin n=1 Tax=Aeromonas sp. MdU4 TaxID=3342819 RepID=UPI0035B6C075